MLDPSRNEQKAIDKAVKLLSADPRHPSLHVHKAKNTAAKYPSEGGNAVFIAYLPKDLRLTFEYGPASDMLHFATAAATTPPKNESEGLQTS